MTVRNTREQYGRVARWFHWSMFFIIVFLLVSGNFMDDIPHGTFRSLLYTVHKSFGVCIFFLACARLIWAIQNRRPKPPSKMRKIEQFLAHGMQNALYVLMFVMPLSGWLFTSGLGYPVNFFWMLKLPMAPLVGEIHVAHLWHEIHDLVGWCLIVLISLHVLAALKHHFINKDNVLRTMLPKRKRYVIRMSPKR